MKDIADGFAHKLDLLGVSSEQIEVNGIRTLTQWRNRIASGNFDFVVAYFDYGQDYDIADFIMPNGSANYVNFSSNAALRYFDEFQKTQDPGRRVECLTQIHNILRDEFPGTFVIAPVRFSVYNQRKIARLYTDDNFFFTRMTDWQLR